MRHAVILAGGSGTRLWPLSRQKSRKQFQTFIGHQTLFQDTYNRVKSVVDPQHIWVVTASDDLKTVVKQAPELPKNQILTEPVGRNTGPALGLATLAIFKRDPAAFIGSFHSDHYVGKPEAFHRAVIGAFALAEDKPDQVVTVGINPTEPNTGLGYIKMGKQLGDYNGQLAFQVEQFIEKPDRKTAQKFLRGWEYLWNSGYFIFQASKMRRYFSQLLPQTFRQLNDFLHNPTRAIYETITAEPIDTAIIEKISPISVIPADLDWSDIGNWATLHTILSGQNGQLTNNRLVTLGNHQAFKTDNCLVISKNKLIATVGVSNLIVIDTDDAILICSKDNAQEVKQLVNQLKEQGKEEYL